MRWNALADNADTAGLLGENRRLRAALERLLRAIDGLALLSDGVAGLPDAAGVAPWTDLLRGGRLADWLGDCLEEADTAIGASYALGERVPVRPRPAVVAPARRVDAHLRFQCPECGMGDAELGYLASERDLHCEICLEEHGLTVRLHRWNLDPGQARLRGGLDAWGSSTGVSVALALPP